MFDVEKAKRGISKMLGGSTELVATFDPDRWFTPFTLFVGVKHSSNIDKGGVVNDDPPIQLRLNNAELSDLHEFLGDVLKLAEEGPMPPGTQSETPQQD